MWRSSTRGLSLLRSLCKKIRVSCTRTDGTSVKRSVKHCQIWSPAELYVVLRLYGDRQQTHVVDGTDHRAPTADYHGAHRRRNSAAPPLDGALGSVWPAC